MDATRDALQNPEKRKAMGGNARQVFETRYSKTIAMQRWEQVLISVLERERIAGGGLVETENTAVFDKKKTASGRSV